MLTIEEIKKVLDAGETVELECIDEMGFISRHECNVENNEIILNQGRLTVATVCNDIDSVILKGNINPDISNTIHFEELQYFRIKRPTPTFDDLIDVAVQAHKDKLIGALNLRDEYIEFDCYPDSYHYGCNKAKEGIDLINSLYTETFVIERNYFPELKVGGKFIQNGIEWELDEERIESIVNTPLFILKGATVTQKRGAA